MIEDLIDDSKREERRSEEVLLTVKEYAAHYGVHIQTVYTAIRFGRRLQGRVERPTSRTIRIAVSRESIEERKGA